MLRQWRAIEIENQPGIYAIEEYWLKSDDPRRPRSHPIIIGKYQHLAFEIADALNAAYLAGGRDLPDIMYLTNFNYLVKDL